jgi:vacuolar-type H+-ATPase subunit H
MAICAFAHSPIFLNCGGTWPVEDILERILSIEAEAKAVVSEAQELATMLKEQAEEEAEEMRTKARGEAEARAAALHEEVRQEVEEARERILSRAGQQPRPVEELDHFQEAVDAVVDAILGRREAEA